MKAMKAMKTLLQWRLTKAMKDTAAMKADEDHDGDDCNEAIVIVPVTK
jgi:hypothetical protein